MTTSVESIQQPAVKEGARSSHSIVITVEQACYAAFALLAAGVRYWGLTRTPLGILEATNSLAAWWSAHALDAPLMLVPTSPLFYQLQRLIFWIGADGDAAARIISVAAGTCLVLTPWLFRRVIGRQSALILSLLFALDPWLVFFSRLADGAILSTLFALSILGCGVSLIMAERESDIGNKAYSYLLAILCGLYVTSGHMAWSFLPVVILFAALNYRTLRTAIVVDYSAGLLFLGAFLLGSTGWLTDPGGVTLISASLTQWVNSVFSAGSPTLDTQAAAGYARTWPLSRLLADEPFVLLFGLGGLLHMSWRRNRYPFAEVRWLTILWGWFLWGAFLAAMPGRSPYGLLVLVFPLLFGAAHLASVMLHTVPLGEHVRETLGVFAILVVLLVSMVFWTTALASSPSLDMFLLQAISLMLLLSAAVLVFFGIYVSWRSAAWAGVVVLGGALLLLNIGSTWRVNHRTDLGRLGSLLNSSTDIDMRQLVTDIEKYSAQTFGDAHEAPILIDVANGGESDRLSQEQKTILAWNLRNMGNLTWRVDPPTPEQQEGLSPVLIITPKLASDEDTPALLSRHVGSTYRLRSYDPVRDPNSERWSVEGVSSGDTRLDWLWTTKLRPWMRWLMYRQPMTPQATEQVVLWAPWQEP